MKLSAKTFLMLSLMLTLLAPFSLLANSDVNGKKETELLKMQRGYFEAIKNKDPDAAVKNLADDYVGVYADGIIDRERENKDLKAFALVLADYQISQEKVSFPNSKTGIVTFRLHVKVVVDGKDFFEDDNIACVWTLQNKKWRMSSQAAVKIRNNS